MGDPGPLDERFEKMDLSIEDIRSGESYPVVCACGEVRGAAYYAFEHNRTGQDDTPVIIEFESIENQVSVDGRDFLYTVFQMGDPDRAPDILCQCFGQGVLRYAKRAWETDDQYSRIALCDLAVFDPEVIASHHRSEIVLAGRYRTVFRNAFFVKLPILPAWIVRVWAPPNPMRLPTPQVHLDDCLVRR